MMETDDIRQRIARYFDGYSVADRDDDDDPMYVYNPDGYCVIVAFREGNMWIARIEVADGALTTCKFSDPSVAIIRAIELINEFIDPEAIDWDHVYYESDHDLNNYPIPTITID